MCRLQLQRSSVKGSYWKPKSFLLEFGSQRAAFLTLLSERPKPDWWKLGAHYHNVQNHSVTPEELERENVDISIKGFAEDLAACLHPTGKYYAPMKRPAL